MSNSDKISLYENTLSLEIVKWHLNRLIDEKGDEEGKKIEAEITLKDGNVFNAKLFFDKEGNVLLEKGEETEEINIGLIEMVTL